MNRVVWAALHRWIRYRRGRMLPENMPQSVWYFAYGSNMNERLFRERRHITWLAERVGNGYLSVIREAARGLPAEYVAQLDHVETRQ